MNRAAVGSDIIETLETENELTNHVALGIAIEIAVRFVL